MNLPEAQGSSHARESKSGIHDVDSSIQDCLGFPYKGQGDALTPDARRNWDLLLTLFIWAALLAMKMTLGEISLR